MGDPDFLYPDRLMDEAPADISKLLSHKLLNKRYKIQKKKKTGTAGLAVVTGIQLWTLGHLMLGWFSCRVC